MRDGSSARSFAKLAVGMMVNRGALALVALLPAPLLHAATASIEGNVVQVLATGDGRFGGCMAALDVAPADSGLDCAGRWVTFSCTGEHAAKEDAHRMFESLRAAVVADKSVEMWVTDAKKHGEYCHASRIKIQDDPHVDEDSDADGVLDLEDDVPLNASETVDTDDDGVGDNTDTDDDNDGVSDADDAFPLDANESVDTDGDGVGDNEDTDDDNDGTLDVDDDCPLDPEDNCVRADLTVESPSVSDSNLNAGASFTFSATVRNEGAGQAAATTLRYYRSTDATITTGDTEVGTDAVSALAASSTSDQSIGLTAPSTAGTYYYGACVETVSGESGTGNNCSSAVRVTVAGNGGGVGSTFSALDADNGYATGIAYANGRFYVADIEDDKVLSPTKPGRSRANSSDAWADIRSRHIGQSGGRLCGIRSGRPGRVPVRMRLISIAGQGRQVFDATYLSSARFRFRLGCRTTDNGL